MKVLNLSCYFNHHQKPLADAMYALLGANYHFVETTGVPEFRKKLGYQEISAPYVLKYNEQTHEEIDRMIMDADAVIYGEAPVSLVKARYNARKLTLRDDECRYRNWTRFLKWPIYTYKSLFINKGNLLCASAYGPIDYLLSGMNPRKCFRWGYFTEVKKYESEDTLMKEKHFSKTGKVLIIWVGRYIGLKHPETAVYVAEKLNSEGYDFEMKMIGSGKLENKIKTLVEKKQLTDKVAVLGSMSPTDVRNHMEKADIFLFTSDRNEGWGAVLNESMNSGCALVADSNIGSVPYLIQDGVNGLIYKSTNKKDAYNKVKYLFDHTCKMRDIGINAYKTMIGVWNPQTAAENVLALFESLSHGEDTTVKEGPCSHAPLLMRTWRGKFKIL